MSIKSALKFVSVFIDILISGFIVAGAIAGMSGFVKLSAAFYLLALLVGVRRNWCIGTLEELFCSTGHSPRDPASLSENEIGITGDEEN